MTVVVVHARDIASNSRVTLLPLGFRSHVRFESKADIGVRPCDVRFTPKSGHGRIHSIILSARAMRVGGILILSLLAVFWLMISSNVVGCCIGRSEGLAPFKILSI